MSVCIRGLWVSGILLMVLSGCQGGDPSSSNAVLEEVSGPATLVSSIETDGPELLEETIAERQDRVIRAELQEYKDTWKNFCDQLSDEFLFIERQLLNPEADNYEGTAEMLERSYRLGALIRSESGYRCWMPTIHRFSDDRYWGVIGKYSEKNIVSRFKRVMRKLEGRDFHYRCSGEVRLDLGSFTYQYFSRYSRWVRQQCQLFPTEGSIAFSIDNDPILAEERFEELLGMRASWNVEPERAL
jgi:hypothetical protein